MTTWVAAARAGLAVGGMAVWLGLSGMVHAGPRDGLPQRNLLVEWRVGGQGASTQRQAGIEVGRVIIDSRRGVIGQAGITAGTVRTESQGSSVQQVMVLNGGRARLYMGRSQSVTAWQLVFSPGLMALPQTVWIDVGEGIHVTPRWSGGRDVVVDIEAQSRQPVQPGSAYGGQLDPDGQTRRTELASTVSVPLGEWVVVARNGGREQRSQSGTLSTRDVESSQSEQLEIRVTAP
ncbi:hypothetical protein EV672_105189 [Aquabacterium commune]|uniref:Uncharacterized protein n=1 Tax=Aquabacterium commune TaxID=70586 RepID=A0A4R6RAH1_9BURK|nr:hypothetical protein [Aquabacterium commune]TDP83002.1 hypothetical protein EV672_105189 [Aquabacterium commune]